MHIDIVFDTICPWCFIGTKRLKAALEQRPETDIQIIWNSFLLNPDMPIEGMSWDSYVQSKFGGKSRSRRIHSAISEAGRSVGLDFRFDKIKWTPNTVDSHRLVKFAERHGLGLEAVDAIYRAYFIDGRDIGRRTVLIDIAFNLGLAPDLFREYLYSDQDIGSIKDQNSRAHKLGISGVPAFIVDGSYSISGAQEPQILKRLLDVAAERRREMFELDLPIS